MPQPNPNEPASKEDQTKQPNTPPSEDVVDDDDDGGTTWPDPVVKPGP
jgi:hypothetical protein